MNQGSRTVTTTGEAGGIGWSGAPWMFSPVIPEGPCPSEQIARAAVASILSKAKEAWRDRCSPRALVLLGRYHAE